MHGHAANVEWILGTAEDLVSLAAKHGGVAAVTLANAIHLVDRAHLFRATKKRSDRDAVLRLSPTALRCGSRTPPGRTPCAPAWKAG